MKLILPLIVLGTATLHAENLYVTPTGGGTGDGTSWTNAFAGLAAVAWGDDAGRVGAGDTLWIAGGTYATPLTIGASGTPAASIEIKRVKASDEVPASADGWSPAFEAKAIIQGGPNACILFTGGVGSYVTIDGRDEYGIRCEFSDGSSGVEIDNTPGTISNITLQYIEAAGPGPIVQTADTRAFDLTVTGTIANLRVSHCSAHHCDTTFQIGRSTGLVVEYCQFYDAYALNPSTFHPNTMILTETTNGIIRFNRMYNIWVEGLFFESGVSENVHIYGNVFHFGRVDPGFAGRGIEFGDRVVGTNFRIYNNTFVSLPFRGIRLNGTSTGTVIKNNVFFDCVADFGNAAHDFNLFSGANAEPNGIANAGNPFVSLETQDFRLAPTGRARNTGQDLGALFDVDLDGRRRGADGAWDMGAYEVTAAGAPSITSATVMKGTYGATLSYLISGSNSPSAYGVAGSLPPGLTFDAGTGRIEGTPSRAGVFEITLVATNGNGTGAAILTFIIHPAPARVSGVTVRERVYDGTTAATLLASGAGLDGLLPGDAGNVGLETANANAAFVTRSAGNAKAVAVSGFSLSGPGAGNYFLVPPVLTATITPAPLTVTGLDASSKVYDGSTATSINVANAKIAGVLTGDSINLTGATGRFLDPNAGAGKEVAISDFVVNGSGTSNYVLVSAPVTANITPAPASISLGNLAHVYDGRTKAVSVITVPPGLPTSLTFGGSVNAPADVGTYDVVAVIADPNYSGTSRGVLTIAGTNIPRPAVTSPNFAAGTIGVPFSYRVTGTSSPTSYGATGLPAGLAIDAGTGLITGTARTEGTSTVTVTASNGGGTARFPLTVVIVPAGSGSQSIAFPAPAAPVTIGQPLQLHAIASSGLPVRFLVLSGNAVLDGNVLTMHDSGQVVVRAIQPGSASFASASTDLMLTPVQGVTGALVYFGTMGTDALALVTAPDNRSGTLFVRNSANNEAIIADLSIQPDGTFEAVTSAAFMNSGAPVAPATATRTLRGRIWNGTAEGTVEEIGAAFTASVEPVNGPTASLAGNYTAAITASATGMTHVIMGTQGRLYALAVAPALVTAGMGTVDAAGTFAVQTTDSTAIRGSASPDSTVISGTLQPAAQPAVELAGGGLRARRSEGLVNLSTRARISDTDGARSLILGFVLTGSLSRRMLLRAIGPGLTTFGVENAVPNPRLQLLDQQGRFVAENDDWENAGGISGATSESGAFPLTAGSRDAALLTTLAPGSYTMEASGGSGITLAEIYDAGTGAASAARPMANISTRAVLDADAAIASGLVVQGDIPARILIRGIGPGLAGFGISDFVADPVIQVYRDATVLARNDDWETPQALTAMQAAATGREISLASQSVGAFALPAQSKDAALVITLARGAYTAVLSGAGNSRGAGLLEIYLLPNP